MAIKLRIACPNDAAGVQAIYAPYCEKSTVSFEVAAPTVERLGERIEKVLLKYPWLICELDGDVAGYVYACQHRERAAYRWSVDVAVYIAESCRRRRVGRALYTTLFSILKLQGYVKAFAGITLPNPASVGLHEALGFEPVAVYRGVGYKLGRWLDVGWWQLALQPETVNPREPLLFTQIKDEVAVAQTLIAGERLVRATPIS